MIVKVFSAWVETRRWGPDDEYLCVPMIPEQVPRNKFKDGDEVEVTVTIRKVKT